jgi:hypothetical protein
MCWCTRSATISDYLTKIWKRSKKRLDEIEATAPMTGPLALGLQPY